MYKIMIADDEGIAIEGLKFIIEKNFKNKCIIESAKSGREVIELSETFRPDIVFMDIRMPGINGIDAIKEIKKTQPEVKFIILTAYDKFSYAQTAVELGVLKYMNKPIDQKQVVYTLNDAMKEIDKKRTARSENLRIKETLETVVPILENGFVYGILFKKEDDSETEMFKRLLGIESEYGYIAVLEFGENVVGDRMTNVTGTCVTIQKYYREIKEEINVTTLGAIVSTPMANRIFVYIPEEGYENNYNKRLEVVENARKTANLLSKQYDLAVRIGIGGCKDIKNIKESYREADNALRLTERMVAHADDVSVNVGYEDDYPIDIEKELFNAVELGEYEKSIFEAGKYYDWMTELSGGTENDIRLKVLEFVLYAERIAYEVTGTKYRFKSRTDYLPSITELALDYELKEWFTYKIGEMSKKIANTKKEKKGSVVGKAKKYIDDNFMKNLSLDSVSMEIDVTPYYFSRLFKEETGINFIEYVNKLRIDKAKELLNSDGNMSIKEICMEVGFSDPNYFSRQFKKYAGISPTEYREGIERG